MFKNFEGFTLIELLVVISIISLLASVVLSSLNSARADAKFSAVKSEVAELAKVFEMNYLKYGTYSQINQTINQPSDCANLATGEYEQQAESICASLINKTSLDGANGDIYIYGSLSSGQKYSIMVRNVPGGVYCAGSSGKYSGPQGTNTGLGCISNP